MRKMWLSMLAFMLILLFVAPSAYAAGKPGPAHGPAHDPAPGKAHGPAHDPAPGKAHGPAHGPAPGKAHGPAHGPKPVPKPGPVHGPAHGPKPGPNPAPGHGPKPAPSCENKAKNADGSKHHPFVICSEADLELLRTYPDAHFVLEADIQYTGSNWISIPSFSGTLDGKHHVISNFKSEEALFQRIEQGAVVKRLTFKDVYVYQPNYRVRNSATIAIDNFGTIEHVDVNGYVGNSISAGGLVITNNGTIKHSRMQGEVESGESAGGIAIGNRGTIQHSKTDVFVKGYYNAGAIASSNYGLIKHIEAKGTVDSFFRNSGGIVGVNLQTAVIAKSVSYVNVYYPEVYPERSGLIAAINEGTITETRSYGQMISRR